MVDTGFFMVLYTYFFNLIDIRALSGKRQPDYQLKRRASKGPVTRNQRSFPTNRSPPPGHFCPSTRAFCPIISTRSFVTLVGLSRCHFGRTPRVSHRRRDFRPCRRPLRHGISNRETPEPMPKAVPAWVSRRRKPKTHAEASSGMGMCHKQRNRRSDR